MRIGFAEIISILTALVIPALILYYVIKLAVVKAITELKQNGIL